MRCRADGRDIKDSYVAYPEIAFVFTTPPRNIQRITQLPSI